MYQHRNTYPPDAQSDEDLAFAIQRGDEQAFNDLVKRHQGRVYAVAYRITCNREDALDVAQEAFVKVYHKIHQWQPTSGFLPWMLRLTVNHAIDMLRKQKRHRHISLDAEYDSGERKFEPATGDARAQAKANEIEERVLHAMQVLSPAQRTVFTLRHYEGMQLAEIAEIMGCTVGSVKVHLFRAMKKMQVELADVYADHVESGEKQRKGD